MQIPFCAEDLPSELTFAEDGEHELKGVPGRWTIWAAT
jgi:hypothetical protein